jgi:hypothetical protein
MTISSNKVNNQKEHLELQPQGFKSKLSLAVIIGSMKSLDLASILLIMG